MLSTSKHIHLLLYSMAPNKFPPLKLLIIYLHYWAHLWAFDSLPLTVISVFTLIPPNCLRFLFSIFSSHVYSTLVKFVYSEIIFVKSIFFVLKYGLAPSDSI